MKGKVGETVKFLRWVFGKPGGGGGKFPGEKGFGMGGTNFWPF